MKLTPNVRAPSPVVTPAAPATAFAYRTLPEIFLSAVILLWRAVDGRRAAIYFAELNMRKVTIIAPPR